MALLFLSFSIIFMTSVDDYFQGGLNANGLVGRTSMLNERAGQFFKATCNCDETVKDRRLNGLKVIGIRPMAPVLNRGPLEGI